MACTDCVLWLTTWFFLWQAGRVPSECTSWRKEQLRGCLVLHSVAAESKPPGQGQLTSLCRSFESSLSHRTLWFPWLCPCPYLAAANTLRGFLCHCPQNRRSQRLLHKMPRLQAAASPSCAHEPQGVLCIFYLEIFNKRTWEQRSEPAISQSCLKTKFSLSCSLSVPINFVVLSSRFQVVGSRELLQMFLVNSWLVPYS